MKIVMLVYRDSLGPVFGSLYAKPAECLAARGYDTRVLCLAPLGEYMRPRLSARWRARMREFEPSLPGRISRWPVAPSRLGEAAVDHLSLAAWLQLSGNGSREVVLHCGGAQAAYMALRARNFLRASKMKVVFQSWGPIGEEFAYGRTGREDGELDEKQARQRDELVRQEAFAYRHAEAAICIAEPMRAFVSNELGVPASRLFTIPCYVDAGQFSAARVSRSETRRRLGFDGKTVFVYSGALHAWQKPAVIFQLFRALEEQIPNSLFFILTPSTELAAALARRHGADERRYRVMSVPFTEMPRYLAASDIGILGRGLFEAESKVNLFSSPIKIPEYLASGCPVVLGQGIGDMSGLLAGSGLGVVAEGGESPEELAKAIASYVRGYTGDEAAIRESCTRFAAEHFDLRRNIHRYEDVYRSVVTEAARTPKDVPALAGEAS